VIRNSERRTTKVSVERRTAEVLALLRLDSE
jgi:hypothetical protein